MINFIWSIDYMESQTQGNLQNVVVSCRWTCVAETTTEPMIQKSTYGYANFPPPGEPFVDYQNLTQDEVLNWVWADNQVKSTTEQMLEELINQDLAPKTQVLPNPWQ